MSIQKYYDKIYDTTGLPTRCTHRQCVPTTIFQKRVIVFSFYFVHPDKDDCGTTSLHKTFAMSMNGQRPEKNT